jgi:RNA-directed DNA polymerase
MTGSIVLPFQCVTDADTMGLFDFLRQLFFPSSRDVASSSHRHRERAPRRRVKLAPLRRRHGQRAWSEPIEEETLPYRFAPYGIGDGRFLDLSRDGDESLLHSFDLPVFHTPEQLAEWLHMPLGQVAWLTNRFSNGYRPENERKAHYHFRWVKKRSGGWRLIEAPKQKLKQVQTQILREILDRVPPHNCAHGFVRRRSIVTNARRHVGQRAILKLDLEDFYANVGFSRVVGIFRGLGYSREAAIWLGRLTTSQVPSNLRYPERFSSAFFPFLRRHLPQGAPSSPALANLSAYGLDVRLSGLARSYSVEYTRYADDLTFSGSQRFIRALPVFIPLTSQIIRDERFRVNRNKRKVVRNNQQQVVAGVVVNAHTNMPRRDFDRLKAILTNCMRHGPASQNRDKHADFAAHLRGRVAHAVQLNPSRGNKLRELYDAIDWKR